MNTPKKPEIKNGVLAFVFAGQRQTTTDRSMAILHKSWENYHNHKMKEKEK